MILSWKKYSSRYKDPLTDLLEEKEYEALSFCSRFISRPKIYLPENKDSIYIYTDSREKILSALMLSKTGQLLPVIKNKTDIKDIDFREAITMLRSGVYYINSLMGEKNIVEALYSAVKETAPPDKITEYNYHIMIIKSSSDFKIRDSISSEESFIFRRPETGDIAGLLPLEEMYEKEEVLPSESLFDPSYAKRYIQNSVKNRISVICEKSGRIISKANTNGEGINFCQIGGVFTLPEFRNRGIGKKVTAGIVEKIFEKGKSPSLFVKKENLPAISAYTKLGFKITSSFKIIYFF